MSSSTDLGARTSVLRESASVVVRPARLDADLRNNPYLRGHRADPRLVDPSLAEAFDEVAVAVREQAHREGYDAGYAAGIEAARADAERDRRHAAELAAAETAQRQAELTRALHTLNTAAAQLDDARARAVETVSAELVTAAFSLAQRLLGRELELATNPGIDAVRRALLEAPVDGYVVLHLHPADAAALDGLDALATVTGGREVRIAVDPSLERGDCIADVGATRIDARLSAAIERVRSVVNP